MEKRKLVCHPVRKFAATAIVSLLLTYPAVANTITKCSSSKGFAYYFKGGLVPDDQAGWRQDGVDGGSIQLVRHGDDFDIFYTDTVGTKSVKADGFDVLSLPQQAPGSFLIIAVNATSQVLQHYLFILDAEGRGTVAWGTARGSGSIFPKSALYTASCASR